jgi:uncharacterized membrane protein
MDQNEINERERTNPANWSRPFAFYHSKLDSRLWVPKQQAWMGRTLNMAKPAARALVVIFVLLLCLLLGGTVLAIVALAPR